MIKNFKVRSGYTLMEMMVAFLLLSMVFAAAISVYTTGVKMLTTRKAAMLNTVPEAISLGVVANKVEAALGVTPTGISQIHLRLDQDCAGGLRNTPSNAGDDVYWHYAFAGNALRSVCDTNAATDASAGAIILDNLNTAVPGACNSNATSSCFNLLNPSAVGPASSNTVVFVHAISTTPVQTMETKVAVGGLSKART